MQSEVSIESRWLVRAVRAICYDRNIELRTFSDDWILELQKGNITRRICGTYFPLNDSATGMIAKDKVATYEILSANGVASVKHVLIQSKVSYDNWSQATWPGGIVLKPLNGAGGHNVFGFLSIDDVREMVEQHSDETWAISPWLDIVIETRLTMLDGGVLLAYDKHPTLCQGLKMFNLGKGATASIINPTDSQKDMACRAMRVLGLRLASVDIIQLASGEMMVLEVNDCITMAHFARTSGEYEQVAYGVYEKIISAMMRSMPGILGSYSGQNFPKIRLDDNIVSHV